jgi:predicted unusual protein kinase regulating ubiquinone biosynthesis (AarF/ABC1/UbiB family)
MAEQVFVTGFVHADPHPGNGKLHVETQTDRQTDSELLKFLPYSSNTTKIRNKT